jgi:hypothetical protein
MKNGRCRVHGGLSPGPPTGSQNNYQHGLFTADARATRRRIAGILRSARKAIAMVDG